MPKRWVYKFIEMLGCMKWCSQRGSSRVVAFYADGYGESFLVHTVLYGFIYDTKIDKKDAVNKKKKKVKDEIFQKLSPIFNKRMKSIEENFKKIKCD